jgi:O-methyltransferase
MANSSGVQQIERAFHRLRSWPARRAARKEGIPPDFNETDREVFRRVRPFTIATPERFYSFARSIEYALAAGIPGAIVECGVWRGGGMMAAALTLLRNGVRDRELVLYDTFAGMTPATAEDVDLDGKPAEQLLETHGRDSVFWAYAGLDEVRRNMESTGYPSDKIRYVVGPVEQTLPEQAPERIAILRLDSDWYGSTKHELEHLYPRLSDGGVLIIDDYGHWQGSRKAVDEYLADGSHSMLLNRVDYTCRQGVKRTTGFQW